MLVYYWDIDENHIFWQINAENQRIPICNAIEFSVNQQSRCVNTKENILHSTLVAVCCQCSLI